MVVPFLVLLAGWGFVASIGGRDEELDLFKDIFGGSPVKAAESGVIYVEREVARVEITMIDEYIIEEYTEGRRERMVY